MEYLRTFACFFVILSHIANWYMREYPKLPMNSYVCSLMLNGICRVSVPIFFMISGALILEQPIDYKKNTKRTVSMIVKTIVWTIIYVAWDFFYLGDMYPYGFDMMFTPVRNHFWFMYVMVGICITTPLWQKLVSGESKDLMRYFSIIFIGTMAATFVINMMRMTITYEVPLVGNSCYAGYFIMGYVIRHYIDEIKINKWICAAVLLFCVTMTNLLTFHFTTKLGVHYEAFSSFRSVFIGLASMTVFYLVMKIKNLKPCYWISVISKHSFNIYMMHVFFLDILQVNIDATKVNAWWGTPVFFVFMLSLSFVFSWVYEKAKGKCQSFL